MRLRTADPDYLAHVDRWWGELLPRVAPYLHGRGGPIILTQARARDGVACPAHMLHAAGPPALHLGLLTAGPRHACLPPRNACVAWWWACGAHQQGVSCCCVGSVQVTRKWRMPLLAGVVCATHSGCSARPDTWAGLGCSAAALGGMLCWESEFPGSAESRTQ